MLSEAKHLGFECEKEILHHVPKGQATLRSDAILSLRRNDSLFIL